MKFETTAKLLTAALRNLLPVIERRNTIPILSCVLFDGRTIRGTDLDMELTLSVPATSAKGQIAIDHRSLLNLAGHIPADDTVRIEGGKEGATVTFSFGRYDLPSLPAADYPEMLADNATPTEVDGEALKKALIFVSPFISTEETRYYLNGICLDDNVAVATDGHRLGCHPAGADFTKFDRPIIPRKAVRLLTGLPSIKSLAFGSEPRLVAGLDGARLVTKLIDGTFPDWRRVVPEFLDEASKVTLDRRQLIAAARRALVARGPSAMPCGTLAWGEGRAALVANNPDRGTAREYLDKAIATGEGHSAFNLRYMIDLLSAFRDDEVTAMFGDPNSPVMVSSGGEAFTVIMPMRGMDDQLAKQTLADWGTINELGRAA